MVFPAASEVGLEIHRALRACKEVLLHGANQPGPSAADFHFRRLHALPPITDPTCLPLLQRLIAAESIDAVFPAYDDVLLWLARQAPELNAEVIAPNADTCTLCRSKKATYQKLGASLPVPRLFDPGDPCLTFPVFVKPDCGQGSQRARRIDNRDDLDRVLASEPDLLVMEYLSGAEYTVDCFSHRNRGVLFAAARRRAQTRNGIATITETAKLPYAQEWAKKISGLLDLSGTWFFQVKEDADRQPHLLEIAPRVAGSMAHSRALGPNFPLLSLYEAAGHDLDIGTFEADMIMGRSLDVRFKLDQAFGALYIDLDDTLIIRGEVNTQLMALIFQCRNRGLPVRLLTRHKSDVAATLAVYRLAQVFDDIIHINNDDTPKAAFIREKNAVLIDDSFHERASVQRQLGIRCFDAAGALCLLDERA